MEEPHWLQGSYTPISYQKYSYYSAPACAGNNKKNSSEKHEFLTQEVKKTFNKLGVPLEENQKVAMDAIFDSVSVSTTYSKSLLSQGILFCSLSQAI